jgi:hypothetical protein
MDETGTLTHEVCEQQWGTSDDDAFSIVCGNTAVTVTHNGLLCCTDCAAGYDRMMFEAERAGDLWS